MNFHEAKQPNNTPKTASETLGIPRRNASVNTISKNISEILNLKKMIKIPVNLSETLKMIPAVEALPADITDFFPDLTKKLFEKEEKLSLSDVIKKAKTLHPHKESTKTADLARFTRTKLWEIISKYEKNEKTAEQQGEIYYKDYLNSWKVLKTLYCYVYGVSQILNDL